MFEPRSALLSHGLPANVAVNFPRLWSEQLIRNICTMSDFGVGPENGYPSANCWPALAEGAGGVGAGDADSVSARWIESGWVDFDSGRQVSHTQGGMQESRHRVWHNRAGAGRTVWRRVLERTIGFGKRDMRACIAALLTHVGDLHAGTVGRVVGSVGDDDGVDLHWREGLEV